MRACVSVCLSVCVHIPTYIHRTTHLCDLCMYIHAYIQSDRRSSFMRPDNMFGKNKRGVYTCMYIYIYIYIHTIRPTEFIYAT